MVARAGRTRLWVLIEHPGPWPHSAPEGVLPSRLVDRIEAVTGHVRLVLIRRSRARTVERPRWVLAWSDGTRHWMREGTATGYDELADLPFDTCAAGIEPDTGLPCHTPLFAVCTHGKKDACCAELGRPIVSALSTIDGADVWECTHIGGDRFAANIVVLPDGLYFSRLGPESARAVVIEHRSGALSLDHLRGRAALSQPGQAAEHAVRSATGIVAVDALEYVSETPSAESVTIVELRIDSRTFRVAVRAGAPRPAFSHGCRSGGTVAWNDWIVDSLEELPIL
ncbi:sucrase ferredoxin [Rhodococcus zopfii]|uniref:Sucrase ferredoxin n=1 Tax=Rhodococcus zopfii TaxID=43772 RepID=A0ABU3WPQ0_9NOCA|nr:sucrase ferredoxin [Rhodococcus zopfii]